jgi:tRNA G18 (ribose-2'-O)-methylase SpoU
MRRWAASRGVRLVGLSPRCEAIWTGLPRAGPIVLMIGEERRGLSPALRAMCDRMVSLPMTGRADSLNVGVAAGVAMYELVRRREEA